MPKDWKPFVSGYLDNELEPEERRAFEREMACNQELTKEVEAMSKLTSVMGGLTLRELPDSAWDSYRARTYNRLERRIGWVLLSVGAIVLIGYGLYEFAAFLIADAVVAWWVRAAIGAVCAGVAVLLVSVIRERLFVWKRDPYREVKR